MHRHAVAGGRHAVLADAPVDVAAGEVVRRDLRRRGDLGVVGAGEVGRAGDEFRHGGRDHVERRLARLAGRDLRRVCGELALVGVDDRVEVLGQLAADAPLEFGAPFADRARRASPAMPRAAACRARRPSRQAARMSSGHDEGLVRPVEVLARAGDLGRARAPRHAPCSFRPWSAGRSRSSSCRRSSSGGRTFCAARTALRIASGSCPSIAARVPAGGLEAHRPDRRSRRATSCRRSKCRCRRRTRSASRACNGRRWRSPPG